MATLRILAAATATNGQPTLATDGKPLRGPTALIDANFGEADDAVVIVKGGAAAVVNTVTVRLWGYNPAIPDWDPITVGYSAAPGVVTDAMRGVLNAGSAIGEITADKLQHSERVFGLRNYTRIYAEIVAIGGVGNAVDVWLQSSRTTGNQ